MSKEGRGEMRVPMDSVREKMQAYANAWRGPDELITRRKQTIIEEVNATARVTELAHELRRVARSTLGEAVYDGVLIGIGENDKPEFGIAVPEKPFGEVLVSMYGEDYSVGGNDLQIHKLVKNGESIKQETLALPEVKAFSANVEQVVIRGTFMDISPYVRKSGLKRD